MLSVLKKEANEQRTKCFERKYAKSITDPRSEHLTLPGQAGHWGGHTAGCTAF